MSAKAFAAFRTSFPPLDVMSWPRLLRALFHHFVGWHRAPQVRGLRRLRPGLRTLRVIPMPWPRLEVAERFIFHQVELGEELGDHSVRAAVIGEEIVPDAVPARTPKNLESVPAQEIAGRLHMRPIAQLERRMEMLVLAGLDQIDGVMVGAAAQEREIIAHPVGHAKTEHVAVKARDGLHVGDMESNVAELVRHDAVGAER